MIISMLIHNTDRNTISLKFCIPYYMLSIKHIDYSFQVLIYFQSHDYQQYTHFTVLRRL